MSPSPDPVLAVSTHHMKHGSRSCRFCGTPLNTPFLDLGTSPLANSYLTETDLLLPESFYPLQVYVCRECKLVQLEEFEKAETIFSDYAYFSSFSDSWLEHCRAYCEMAADRFRLASSSKVIEIGSNDGYLLQFFVEKGIPVLGIEPAGNVAQAAIEKGIATLVEYFNENSAKDLVSQGVRADLLIGNNVLAHQPRLNSFVHGLKSLLAPQGVLTMEFPHLMRLIDENQFDTIYHEHFSYFSMIAIRAVFDAHGLSIFDVQELPTHGGSLRIFAQHKHQREREVSARVSELIERERAAGLEFMETYFSFGERVARTKRALLAFLIKAKDRGERVVGYGAPAKGNTLLNYCGVRTDILDYTVDRSPHKQGRYLPGTRIPIYAPEKLLETKPDYVLILPWNLKEEIAAQIAHVRDWGGQFVIPIPEVELYV